MIHKINWRQLCCAVHVLGPEEAVGAEEEDRRGEWEVSVEDRVSGIVQVWPECLPFKWSYFIDFSYE